VGLLSGLTNQSARSRPDQRPRSGGADGPDAPRSAAGVAGIAARATPDVLAEIDRMVVQVVALVGEAIAGATHALLACDREAAKQLMARDDLVDERIVAITALAQRQLVSGRTTEVERKELVTVLRMLPDLDRNGDLAEHIARRAARGLGAEMSPRSRGLVERMGEVAAAIWSSTADAFSDRSVQAANAVDALDDELDELHVGLTAELATGTMAVPVAIELAMVARFYERFGDHAVNLARRISALSGGGGPEPSGPGAD
jgi:phosphate transport system protein